MRAHHANKKNAILLLFCLAAISATTYPTDTRPTDVQDTPGLTLFIQGDPVRYGKRLSLVFEVANPGRAGIEVDHSIYFMRDYSDLSDEAQKFVRTGPGLWFDEGATYMLRIHISGPFPRDKRGFLMGPDSGINGNEPLIIAPGESLLYRIDLPAELRLNGICEITLSLIQHKHVIASSDTAKIDVQP